MSDRWIDDLRDAVADSEPTSDFVEGLGHDLVAEWGRVQRRRRGVRWWTAVASIALLTGLVATLAIVARDDAPRPASRPTSTDTVASPSTTLTVPASEPTPEPTATTASTAPPTTAAPTTPSAAPTTSAPPTPAPLDCAATTPIESFMDEFADEMVLARTTDRLDLIGNCVAGTPAIYDGRAPNCWTECPPATRTFHLEHALSGQLTNVDGDVWWITRLPVTYVNGTAIIDVIELWSVRPVEGRYVVDEFRIETPIVERQRAVDTINEYFQHLADEDWEQAADLLVRASSADFPDRFDLQQLGAASDDIADIADALARWCADGCDTTPTTREELDFIGGYELTRGGQTIPVRWFEGTYGIGGPPIR